MSAASVNFGDIARCRGTVASVMGQVPFTLGMDVCGVVEAAGDGAEHWLGRRVVAMTNQSFGGMAESALAAHDRRVRRTRRARRRGGRRVHPPLPHGVPRPAHARPDSNRARRSLVVGAAGAVGTAVIQLGIAAGARVLALAAGPEKGRLCEELGAVAVDYADDDVFDRVMELTDGVGAEVVCDLVGGDRTETIWTCTAREGRYLPVGFNDDPEAGLTGRPLRKVSMGNISILGVMLGYASMPVELRRFGINTFPPETGVAVHAALCELVAAGTVRPGRRPPHLPRGGGGRARRPRAPPDHRPHRRRPHPSSRMTGTALDGGRGPRGVPRADRPRRLRTRRLPRGPRRPVRSIRAEAQLSDLGDLAVRDTVVAALADRQRVVDWVGPPSRGRRTSASSHRSSSSACSGPGPRSSAGSSTTTRATAPSCAGSRATACRRRHPPTTGAARASTRRRLRTTCSSS